MKKLNHSSLYNNVHFLAIGLVLAIFTLQYWWMIIFLFVYLVFILQKTPFCKYLLFIYLNLGVSYFQYYPVKIPNEFRGLIIKKDDYSFEVLTTKGIVKLFGNHSLSLGDYGIFFVDEYHFSSSSDDYQEYLLNRGIKGVKKYSYAEITDNYFVIGKIQNFLVEQIEKHYPQSARYITTLLIGENNLESELNTSMTNLGLSHLLAISGLHITIIIALFKKGLDCLILEEKKKRRIINGFLIMYMVITNFSLSVLRSALMVIFKNFFQTKHKLYTSLDILSLITIIILLICPKYLFLVGFQLSFLISFIMITFVPMLKRKGKIIQSFQIAWIAFLASLPIIINLNYEINFLTLIASPIFSLYFEIILLPVTIIIVFMPFLENYLMVIFQLFENSIFVFNSLEKFRIITGKFSEIVVLVYYILLFLFMLNYYRYKKTFKTFFLLYLAIIIFNPFTNKASMVKFYDVGQGDSILVYLPNSATVLIDCYGDITTMLKRDGIKKIDCLIVTHTHLDHYDAIDEILSCYKIDNIYTSIFTNYKLLNNYNPKLLKSGDEIQITNFIMHILAPIEKMANENDNALVIQFALDEVSYLLTSDIEKNAEKLLVQKYQHKLKCDILKVAHHGSNTSSSKLFLNYTDPQYLVISVGKNNKYNFPNHPFLLTYPNLYRTDLNQSITFIHRANKIYLKTG